jgi:hypothetical protein
MIFIYNYYGFNRNMVGPLAGTQNALQEDKMKRLLLVMAALTLAAPAVFSGGKGAQGGAPADGVVEFKLEG